MVVEDGEGGEADDGEEYWEGAEPVGGGAGEVGEGAVWSAVHEGTGVRAGSSDDGAFLEAVGAKEEGAKGGGRFGAGDALEHREGFEDFDWCEV